MKPRFATVWLGGCSGCHMSFLDLDERLIELASLADVCYSPFADIKHFPENVDVTLVEGAVANADHLRDIRLIRDRTKTLVAFGDCAVTGNVTAIRNLFGLEEVLERVYNGVRFECDLVPPLLRRVLRVHDVVHVDFFLPGCPPSANSIWNFVLDLLAGRAPVCEGRKFGA